MEIQISDSRYSASGAAPRTKCVLCKTWVDSDPEIDFAGNPNQNWLNQISESILSLLSLGQEVYFPIFSTATYCSNCLQLVRDADWTFRTVSALTNKLDELKQEITSLFWAENPVVRQKINHSTPLRTLGRPKSKARQSSPNVGIRATSSPVQGSSRSLRERKAPTKFSEYEVSLLSPTVLKSEYGDEGNDIEILPDFHDDGPMDMDLDPLSSGAEEDSSDSDTDDFDAQTQAKHRRNKKKIPSSSTKTNGGDNRNVHPTRSSSRNLRTCTFENCNFSTGRDQYLQKHVESVHLNPNPDFRKQFQCDIGDCERKFSSFNDFKKHRSEDHNESKKITNNGRSLIRCTYKDCKYTSTVLKHFKAHVKRKHTGDPKPYGCEQCGQSYTKALYLRMHELTHDPTYIRPTIPCTVSGCESVFLSARSLKTHIAIAHWEYGKLKCDVCWKMYEENDEMKYNTHLDLHKNSVEPFACVIDKCHSVFSCTMDLRNHYVKVHNPTRVQCQECDQVCKNEAHLASHMKNHRRKNRTQTENEPCSHPGCNYIPRSNYDRRTHAVSHTDQKEYKCDECGSGFKWKSGLTVHMRTHQDNFQPFKCLYPGCNKQFKIGQKLKLHEERCHSKLRPYVCHICAKDFKSRNDLGCHIRRSHPDMDDEVALFKIDALNRRRRENRLKLKARKSADGQEPSKRSKLSNKSHRKTEGTKYEAEEIDTEIETELIETQVIHEVVVRDAENAEEMYFPE